MKHLSKISYCLGLRGIPLFGTSRNSSKQLTALLMKTKPIGNSVKKSTGPTFCDLSPNSNRFKKLFERICDLKYYVVPNLSKHNQLLHFLCFFQKILFHLRDINFVHLTLYDLKITFFQKTYFNMTKVFGT